MNALAEYARVLRSRWRWVMWGILLALVATTVFLIVQPPLYRTTATVFVRTPGDVSQVIDGGDSYAQGRAKTYAVLASGTNLSSRVIADLGLDITPDEMSRRIHAENPPGTAIIDLSVGAPSPAEARRTSAVLLAEYASMVQTLEAVPGSLVPRAQLVVVDPPRQPVRVAAWGAPIPIVLVVAGWSVWFWERLAPCFIRSSVAPETPSMRTLFPRAGTRQQPGNRRLFRTPSTHLRKSET